MRKKLNYRGPRKRGPFKLKQGKFVIHRFGSWPRYLARYLKWRLI
jgi:hypothetical protein